MDPLAWKPHVGQEQVFMPDESKGYFEWVLATGFPDGRTQYGWGLHPQVVANSYTSIMHQMVDWEHHRQANDPKYDDRFLGSVVAASFPPPPNGMKWRLTDKPAPAIRGVATFNKQAQGLRRILGDHLTGRHTYSVSMDVTWNLEHAGYAVPLNGDKPEFDDSPEDFVQAGYEYVSPQKAPPALKAIFSKEENRVTKKYKGKDASILLAGLDGRVQFCGLACVRYGAEPTARMGRVAASASDPGLEGLAQLPGLMNQIIVQLALKPKVTQQSC